MVGKSAISGQNEGQFCQTNLLHERHHSPARESRPSLKKNSPCDTEEENEKMEALKKAYAEIILNTSKEAAARVMASERKAQQFEHDLKSTKEEASRMLLRLKQMLDAKTTAAEITYSNQRQKIEELEAQLNEAEGVIVDLRVELKQAQEQLDQVQKHHLQPSNGPFEMGDMRCSGGMPVEKNLIDFDPSIISTMFQSRLLSSDDKTPTSDVNFVNHEVYKSAKQTVMPYLELKKYIMDDHASIRSMEPELYRNGCTEIVHAIERRGDKKALPGDGQHVTIMSEAAIKVNEPSMNVSSMSSSKTERCNAMGNLSGLRAAFAKGTKDFSFKSCKLRKRKSQYGKSKFSSCKFHSCRSKGSQQSTSAVSHCKSFWCTSNTMDNSCEGTCTASSVKKSKMGIAEHSSKVVQNMQLDKDQAVSVVRRSLRKRKIKQWDDFTASWRRQGSRPDKSRESARPYPYASCCKTNLVNCKVKSGEEKSNIVTEAGRKEDLDTMTGLMDVATHTRVDADSTLVNNTKTRNSELIDKSVVVKQEGHASELELEDIALLDLDMSSKSTDDALSQVESNRLFKYTFCRKRKKASLIYPDENSAVGESSRKRRSGGKQNIASGPQGSNKRTELSKHSKRVVQIARQLISLSGRNSRQ